MRASSLRPGQTHYCGDGDVWGFGKLPAPGGKLYPHVLRLLAPEDNFRFSVLAH